MRKGSTDARKGFTLIELLTVIAIIAVLAAILFPVVNGARRRARKAACISNLSQIAQAVTLYVQDYNGFLPSWSISHPGGPPNYPGAPPAAERNVPTPGVITWDMSIGSHLRDNRILLCRENPNTPKARAYSIAQYTQKYKGPNLPLFGCYKDSVRAPVKTVLLFEKGANLPGSWGDALGQNVHQTHASEGEADYNDKPFHYEGKNFLYLDGHVAWAKMGSGPFAYKSTRTDAQPGDVMWAAPQKADGTGGDWPDPD